MPPRLNPPSCCKPRAAAPGEAVHHNSQVSEAAKRRLMWPSGGHQKSCASTDCVAFVCKHLPHHCLAFTSLVQCCSTPRLARSQPRRRRFTSDPAGLTGSLDWPLCLEMSWYAGTNTPVPVRERVGRCDWAGCIRGWPHIHCRVTRGRDGAAVGRRPHDLRARATAPRE